MARKKIGIIGGTGLYSILDSLEEKVVSTPYGSPSAPLMIGQFEDKDIVFLPRHGTQHQLPPHSINYQANIWALKEEGVGFIIAPAAAGSLQRHIKPGDFVVPDQFVDRTRNRKDTFYDEAPVTHMPGVEPYCKTLRNLANVTLKNNNLPYHENGTTVVIQGPRFSTKAESKWFTKMDWDVINMTIYPEAILARELEMSYVNIMLITDYDSGFDGEFPPVIPEEAVRVFKNNTDKLKSVVLDMIKELDVEISTDSHSALSFARF